ncbi:hypothetical protein BSR29_00360 [Boudabousia liubingyangii]|uniref:Uncharacterized protein n=1 Tax=Boudabousia liubingyangii TaxID=1921764 RepID=A0A1Q5PPL0_9ACTO|nr:DUF5979 domain-containing protein [Boudabousia liubingyangii]OKL49456.1 hypothetical protein BSR29_00360 [Boudabousia liubingyangii]
MKITPKRRSFSLWATALIAAFGMATVLPGGTPARAEGELPRIQIGEVGMAMSNPSVSEERNSQTFHDFDCIYGGIGTDTKSLSSVYNGAFDDWSASNESWINLKPGQKTNKWSYLTHGQPVYGEYQHQCPPRMYVENQSAIGVQPNNPGSVTLGETFLLGKIRHRNNDLWVSEGPTGQDILWFHGDFQINIAGKTDSFPWDQWETYNTCAQKVDPDQRHCSDDILQIKKNHSEQIFLDQNGVRYFLNIWGFVPALADGSCPADPGLTRPRTKFITTESRDSNACIYASFNQQRSIRLAKTVTHGPGINEQNEIPAFNLSAEAENTVFDSYKTWQLRPQSYGPAGTVTSPNNDRFTYTVGMGESYATEDKLPTSRFGSWQLTDITCTDRDGDNVPIPQEAKDLAARRLDLNALGAAKTGAEQELTCTFHNHLAAPPKLAEGTLKIQKTLNDENQGLKNPNQEFTVNYRCETTATPGLVMPQPAVPLSGSVKITTQKPALIEHLPAGAKCSFNESEPRAQWLKDENYHWEAPQITPQQVQVAAGKTVAITVNNRIRYEKPIPPSFPIQIQKLGSQGPLKGAQFTIHADQNGKIGEPLKAQLQVQANGATFISEPLQSEQHYWLKETQAPFGHRLLAQAVRFEVTQSGIKIDAPKPAPAAGNTLQIDSFQSVKVNPKNPFQIQVTDSEIGELPKAGALGNWPYAMAALGLALSALIVQKNQKKTQPKNHQ